MSEPRDEVLAAIGASLTVAWRQWLDHFEPSDEERRLARAFAVFALGGSVVETAERKSALSMNATDLSAVHMTGGAAHELLDMWPSWSSSPRRTVADQLKIADRDTLLRVRRLIEQLDGRL